MVELIFRNGRCLNKEDETFEAKSMSRGIPESLWESYSAFANTLGGTIVLGLGEPGDGSDLVVEGVKNPYGIRDDLWSTLNNNQKVSTNVMMDRDLHVIPAEGKELIVMDVPAADRTMRPVYIRNINGGTFKRNGSGDYHCNADDIAAMFRDAVTDTIDLQPARYTRIEDLNRDSIEGYRKLMSAINPLNDWLHEPIEEFLRLIGAACRTDDGIRPTLAGLIMFGDEASISAEVPGYCLDYREYDNDGIEWSFRRLTGTPNWSGNLFDFYTFVAGRIQSRSKTGFRVPEGMTRVDDSPLIRAMREALANAVVNADYMGRGGVVVEIRPESFTIINAGTFRIPLEKAETGGFSDPRNKNLSKMMNLIGRAERAGTGIRMIVMSCRKLGLESPTIVEGQRPDRVTLSIEIEDDGPNVKAAVLDIVSKQPKTTMDEMAKMIGVPKNRILTTISELKENGTLVRTGGTRGRWSIMDTDSIFIDDIKR